MQLEQIKAAGLQAFREKNFALAYRYFLQGTEAYPEDIELQERFGMAALYGGKIHEALDAFLHSIELNPHRAEPFINTGAIYNRLQDFDRAVDYLQRGIQRNSKSVEAFFNLGFAYRKLGEHRLSLSAFKEVLRLNSLEWEAWYNMGKVYRDQNNLIQEINCYQAALKIVPDNARVQAALKEADKEQRSAKETVNPFGRLVEPIPQRQNTSTTILPVLSVEDRAQDRDIVRLCALAADIAARELLETLKSTVRETLEPLRSAISAGKVNNRKLHAQQQAYRQQARTLAKQRERLQQKMVQLKQHEQQVLERLEQAIAK